MDCFYRWQRGNFVNRQHILYVNSKGETFDVASGYCQPFSFDVTAALAPGAKNLITIEATRLFLNGRFAGTGVFDAGELGSYLRMCAA